MMMQQASTNMNIRPF